MVNTVDTEFVRPFSDDQGDISGALFLFDITERYETEKCFRNCRAP